MKQTEILELEKQKEQHPLHDCARSNTLNNFIEIQTNESFSEMLFRLIRERHLSETEVYKTAELTPQHFSKIRSAKNYKPTKETVLSLAIALKLNLPETKDLMRTAGFAFTHANKTDMVIEYFIINKNWNLFEINQTLDSFGLNPLR